MNSGLLVLFVAGLFVAGVQGHGWLSFPESRNSRVNRLWATTPGPLQGNRMNGNGQAAWIPRTTTPQPGEIG